MSRAVPILGTALLVATIPAPRAFAGIVSSDFAAWWEMNDTSDSSPIGSRPLTLLGGAILSGGALQLDTDPSNNRARTSAFNATSSFSIFIDFQADSIPSGGSDPQYTLLSNIGNDEVPRTFSGFLQSAGYQVFLTPTQVRTFQKTGGSFSGAVGTGVSLSNPTGRNKVVINWEYHAGLNQFRSSLFLNGSTMSNTSGYGPMDFTTGVPTTNLLLGTNVDEAFQPPRTFDGSLYEVAIFNRLLTVDEIDELGTSEISPVPEPSSLALLGMGALGVVAVRRRKKSNDLAAGWPGLDRREDPVGSL